VRDGKNAVLDGAASFLPDLPHLALALLEQVAVAFIPVGLVAL